MFAFCVRFGEVGVAFFDHLVGVAMAELAGHGCIAGRFGAVGCHRTFCNVTIVVFLVNGLSHGSEWMIAEAERLP